MKLLFILPGYKVVFLVSLPRTTDRMRQTGSVVSTITNSTPADLYLRGHLKSIVYLKRVNT
jgi:hypothetical protein